MLKQLNDILLKCISSDTSTGIIKTSSLVQFLQKQNAV